MTHMVERENAFMKKNKKSNNRKENNKERKK